MGAAKEKLENHEAWETIHNESRKVVFSGDEGYIDITARRRWRQQRLEIKYTRGEDRQEDRYETFECNSSRSLDSAREEVEEFVDEIIRSADEQ